MKKLTIVTSALLLTMAATTAFAQQGAGRGITFESLDADGDGVVTKEEFAENFKPPAREGRTPNVEAAFARFDADEDGKITKEEFDNRPRRQRQ